MLSHLFVRSTLSGGTPRRCRPDFLPPVVARRRLSNKLAFSTRNASVVSHSIRGNHAACSIYVGGSRRRTAPNWLFHSQRVRGRHNRGGKGRRKRYE